MVLGKFPVPGRPTSLITRAYCACSRCGWGWFGHFYSHISFLLFLPLFEKYCLKGPLNPKQPTNQPKLTFRLSFNINIALLLHNINFALQKLLLVVQLKYQCICLKSGKKLNEMTS